MELKIWNKAERIGIVTIQSLIENEIFPGVQAFHEMLGNVVVLAKVGDLPPLKILIHPPDAENPVHWYEVEHYHKTLTARIRLSAVFYHPASHYQENFAADGDTLTVAFARWKNLIAEREIKVNYRGDIGFPGITFYLCYRPVKGGWQPTLDERPFQYPAPVYLDKMLPRWGRAWDKFCAENPKFANRDRDKAQNLIKIAAYEGPVLEVD